MNGFMGNLLVVDLTRGRTSVERLNEGWAREYVGGAALAARYLYELVDRTTDPLGPENPLLFMTGPLVGTTAPSCGRYVVCARSPQTGLWGEANSGGRFGPTMRFAGYDGILITGRSPSPVCLTIIDGQAELCDAGELWGMDTYATQAAMKKQLGNRVSIACIGPAGENLVRYAAIINDAGRAAARTGMGAVMGSKRLKAIAVAGTRKVPLADPASFAAARQAALQVIAEDPRAQFLTAGGTASSTDTYMWMGDVPIKYFRQGFWESVSKLGGGTMAETILTGRSACYRCPIGCGRVTSIGGIHATANIDGPEYETTAAYGSLLMSDDLSATAYASHLCNRYGLDTISAGSTIALAYELYERGLLTEKDTGGLDLRWGDVEPALVLTEQIAQREGLGEVLAEGSRVVAQKYGVEELAVQVNGLEVAMHDPRAFVGMALTYATSPRGACHAQSDMFLVDLGAAVPELGIEMGNRLESSAEKALMTARVQDLRSLYNSMVTCMFCNAEGDQLVGLLNGATGWDLTLTDLLPLGERGFQLKRLLNHRLGLTAANDRLPARLLEPLPDIEVETAVPDMHVLLTGYYQVRGWDVETGVPTVERIRALGLSDLAE